MTNVSIRVLKNRKRRKKKQNKYRQLRKTAEPDDRSFSFFQSKVVNYFHFFR